MNWKKKVGELYHRFGAPAKFAAKLVLGSVVPGGSAIVDLVGLALDCVDETARDQIQLAEAKMSAVSAADLQRLEGVLDILNGDLGALMAQMAALKHVPELAKETLALARKNDAGCQAGLHKLDEVARGIKGLHVKTDHLHVKTDQMDAKLDKLLRLHVATQAQAASAPSLRTEVIPPKPQRKAGEVYTNALDMKFAWIPPGAFLMGSPANEPKREDYAGADETQHGVTLTKGFHLGIYQVTQAKWQAVMDGNPSHFKGDRLPVERVSWDDAKAFCISLGRIDGKTYCLPTEAQWEYACRAGMTTPFHFGGTITTNEVNYNNSRRKTTPVGSFKANTWGFFDMHGNVWEWCADTFGPYQKQELKDPHVFVAGDDCVLRGGSFFDQQERCRSAFRTRRPSAARFNFIGLRVCLLLD